MAKKVVATLKTGTGKNFTKCIKMVKSDKTGAYPVAGIAMGLHVQGRHHPQRPSQRILRGEEISILRAILNTKGIRQGALCIYTLRRKAQIRMSVCYFRAKRVTLVKNTRNATANHRFLQLALSIRRSGNGNAQSRLLLSQTGLPHNSVYREVEPRIIM